MRTNKEELFDCKQCVFRTLSCRFIASEDFDLIQKASVQLKFTKGEVVFKQGVRAQSLIFLHHGIVKFSYQYETGHTYIMTAVRGPKLLGGANLFFQETNIFSITAIEDCEICQIDLQAFVKVVMNNPAYILALCESTMNMFQHSIFNFISLAHNQVNGRIANVLLYLWEHVYRNSGFDFTMSRKEIAQFAACSHENVINTLSKFNKDGLIELDGKKIIIKDIQGLNEISKKG
jgi:CRP-like cAMP-binding protein